MHHACYGSFSSVVDVCHGTRDGSGGRDTAKQRGSHVGNTLCYQFRVGIVFVAYHTIGHGGRQQRFDGTQYSDCNGYGEQVLYRFPIQAGITASGSSARMLKRSPMVSIQSMPPYTFISQTATVTTMMAISDPGIFFENRGVMAMMKMLTILTIVFHQLRYRNVGNKSSIFLQSLPELSLLRTSARKCRQSA